MKAEAVRCRVCITLSRDGGAINPDTRERPFRRRGMLMETGRRINLPGGIHSAAPETGSLRDPRHGPAGATATRADEARPTEGLNKADWQPAVAGEAKEG